MVYSQGIDKNRFYSEAKRVLNNVEDYDRFTSIQSFYKDKFRNPMEDLMNDLKAAKEEVKAAVEEEAKTAAEEPKNDVDKRRAELIHLVLEDDEIDQSAKYLKKASAKVLNKLHAEYEAKGLEKGPH